MEVFTDIKLTEPNVDAVETINDNGDVSEDDFFGFTDDDIPHHEYAIAMINTAINENSPSSQNKPYKNDLVEKYKMKMAKLDLDSILKSIEGLEKSPLEVINMLKDEEKKIVKINEINQILGLNIRSKITNQRVTEEIMSSSTFDYYSDEFYVVRGPKKIPLWSEPSIARIIMSVQEQFPAEIIKKHLKNPKMSPADILKLPIFSGSKK